MDHAMKIAIVDDDPTARLTAAAALDAPHYALRECANGEALLATIADDMPDLILLDIEMIGMNGIETCRALRAAGGHGTHVMFVSAHNDLDTRLIAYEAGGDNFIAKPYEPEELARKVEAARLCILQRRELGDQARFAEQTAFAAMSYMAEMGVVLEFLRASFSSNTCDDLAAALFGALRQYGLDGLVRLHGDGSWRSYSSKGECTPLETGILEHAALLERIFEFRDRLSVNYPNLTLIVHPLPLDDPERVGRLRDHLAVLAEGADTRLSTMANLRRQQLQASGIGDAVAELSTTLEEIDRLQASHRLQAAEIDEAYLAELIDAFVHLGLTEDQETTLADMAQRTHLQLAALRDAGSNVSDHLRAVVRKLNQLVAN